MSQDQPTIDRVSELHERTVSKMPNVKDARLRLVESYLRRDLQLTPKRYIARRPLGCQVPLTWGQQQLWQAAQDAGNAPIDAEIVTLEMAGAIDVDALQRSFDELVRRHEILRTTIVVVDGNPIQMVGEPMPFPLSIVDLSILPALNREEEVTRLATEQARRAFDLAVAPPLRATLVRIDEERHLLCLVLHHFAFDCFASQAVFLPELAAAYAAFVVGAPSPLPELSIQYGDFAVWQHGRLGDPRVADDLQFWRQQLRSCPEQNLQTDRPRPETRRYRGAVFSAVFPERLAVGLASLSHREGSTLFMTLTAALQTLILLYTGRCDVVIGTEAGVRSHSQLEGLIGYFLNTFVLRTDLSGNPRFSEALRRVRRVATAAYERSDVPFEYLVEDREHDAGSMGQFCVMLRFGPPPALLGSGWTVIPLEVDPGVAKYDLTIDLCHSAEGLMIRLEYDTDLFNRETVKQFLFDFRTVLESVVGDPEARLSALLPKYSTRISSPHD